MAAIAAVFVTATTAAGDAVRLPNDGRVLYRFTIGLAPLQRLIDS